SIRYSPFASRRLAFFLETRYPVSRNFIANRIRSTMLPTTSGGSSHTVVLPNEEALRRLVTDLAIALEPGDLVTLSGELGAGKPTLARALIRHLAGDPTVEVPSPTFTLIQTYDLPRFPLVHADLYRVSGASELAELGFEDLPAGAVTLLPCP